MVNDRMNHIAGDVNGTRRAVHMRLRERNIGLKELIEGFPDTGGFDAIEFQQFVQQILLIAAVE